METQLAPAEVEVEETAEKCNICGGDPIAELESLEGRSTSYCVVHFLVQSKDVELLRGMVEDQGFGLRVAGEELLGMSEKKRYGALLEKKEELKQRLESYGWRF